MFKAERSAEPLRVYNLRYDDSAETDQFSAGLARERRALESLIADKAHMVLPANPDPAQVQPCRSVGVRMRFTTSVLSIQAMPFAQQLQTPACRGPGPL